MRYFLQYKLNMYHSSNEMFYPDGRNEPKWVANATRLN